MKITTVIILALLPFFGLAQPCFNPGSGIDGVYLASVDTTIVGGTYNFTSFTINSGVTVTVTGTAPLYVYCTGIATINGILSASGANGTNGITFTSGGIGGIGVAGGGNGGGGSFSSSTGPINGEDGFNIGGAMTLGSGWSGGGGAGYETNGFASGGAGGGAGNAYGDAQLSSLLSGSGGGGGSGGFDCGAGGGGAGGGLIVLNANSIVIGAAGVIQCNGGNGGSDGTGNCGGGGAGSGGAIWIATPSLTNDGSVSAIGGIGGQSTVPNSPYFGVGGNGANGRIRIDVNGMISGMGSVTPTVGYSTNVVVLESTQNLTLCAGDSVIVGSTTYTISGNYVQVLTASTGCDSTVTTNLTVLPVLASSSSLTACAGDSVMVGSGIYGMSGTYVQIWTSSTGCDSTVTTNLTILPTLASSSSLIACAGDSVIIGAGIYTMSGTYVEIWASLDGCDSTVTTNLTVLPQLETSQNLTICAGDSVTVGTATYTTTGNYVEFITISSGCDSVVVTNLTVEAPINVTLSINQGIIQVGESNATYQWLDCDNNNAPISQATNQSFIPNVNGNYAVEVTVNGCTTTSVCSSYNLVGMNEFADLAIQLYPNPTSNVVTVSFGIEVPVEQLIVTDVTGRLVYNQSQFTATSLEIDLSSERKGVYFLNVEVNGRVQTLKITKQ